MTDTTPAVSPPSLDISVVIPVYGYKEKLCELIERVRHALDNCVSEEAAQTYEIILIDDCGPGSAWDELCRLHQQFPEVAIVRLTRNFGQHNALMCGLSLAQGNRIVTLDDDLQNPPEEIPRLLRALEQNEADVVYGVARSPEASPFRKFGSRIMQAAYSSSFGSRTRISSFRAMRRDLAKRITSYNKSFTFIDGLITWHTQSVATLEVEHHARQEGRSGYSTRRLIVHALDVLTNFSVFPLRLTSLVGVTMAAFAMFVGFYYLLRYMIIGIPVPGYTSIVVSVTLLAGVQLLSLGIIGEYLGRLHLNVSGRPQFEIREAKQRRL
ncbi:MAG: glycosyltransferase family 2 protein [Bdellovibrionales bacterium]|nr:glycosyltransferase family 2 protein [Bdellovibrionales bacterium]